MLANLAYLSLMIVGSPIILYRAIRHGRYRRGWDAKLFGVVPHQLRNTGSHQACRIWLHAVSVGEVTMLKGLVASLQERHPDAQLIISSSTDTGHVLAQKLFGTDRVLFAPLDFSWAVRRALRAVDPDLLILAELEIWPNWIRIASQYDVPVAVINGRLSERSHRRYQRIRRLVAPTFKRLSMVACQDLDTRTRFVDLGADPDSAYVTGSIKYDAAPTSRDSVEIDDCYVAAGIEPWHRVWLAGSTQSGEEEIALRVYAQLMKRFPELRLILVPRHRERFDDVADLILRHGFTCRRHSDSTSATRVDSWHPETVYLVDTIGELTHWWGTAQIAFVGGSFGHRGGQNMLEPAGYGAAVAFGPSTHNFKDIVAQLKTADAAVEVHDEQALLAFVAMCLDDPPRADALGRAAREAVGAHRGATERTLDALHPWLAASLNTHKRAA